MKLEYCLVKNVHSKKKEVIFCITQKGYISLDRTIVNTKLYNKVSKLIKDEGFVEAEKLWFECRDKEVNIKELKKKLFDLGIDESQELTDHTLKMIEETYMPKPLKDNGDPNFFNPEYGQLFDFEPYPFEVSVSEDGVSVDGIFTHGNNSNRKKTVKKNQPLFTYRLPDNQEEIPVCFNLFIDAVLKDEETIIFELRGDMFNKQSTPTSKFLRPIQLDFRRVVYSTMKETDPIIFQSIKTSREIYEECIDCLQDIDFRLTKEIAAKSPEKRPEIWNAQIKFSILELKEDIIDNAHIVFYMPKEEDFQNFCKFSDQIEEEIRDEEEQVFPKTIVSKTLQELKSKMNSKMIEFSKNEEYEEASNQQKIVSIIDEKVSMLEEVDEFLSIKDYRDKFVIGKF